MIIFHADHGYFMGESGEWEKKMLFENTARVPLIIYDPAKVRLHEDPAIRSTSVLYVYTCSYVVPAADHLYNFV